MAGVGDFYPLNVNFVPPQHLYLVGTIVLDDDELNDAGVGQRFTD